MVGLLVVGFIAAFTGVVIARAMRDVVDSIHGYYPMSDWTKTIFIVTLTYLICMLFAVVNAVPVTVVFFTSIVGLATAIYIAPTSIIEGVPPSDKPEPQPAPVSATPQVRVDEIPTGAVNTGGVSVQQTVSLEEEVIPEPEPAPEPIRTKEEETRANRIRRLGRLTDRIKTQGSKNLEQRFARIRALQQEMGITVSVGTTAEEIDRLFPTMDLSTMSDEQARNLLQAYQQTMVLRGQAERSGSPERVAELAQQAGEIMRAAVPGFERHNPDVDKTLAQQLDLNDYQRHALLEEVANEVSASRLAEIDAGLIRLSAERDELLAQL